MKKVHEGLHNNRKSEIRRVRLEEMSRRGISQLQKTSRESRQGSPILEKATENLRPNQEKNAFTQSHIEKRIKGLEEKNGPDGSVTSGKDGTNNGIIVSNSENKMSRRFQVKRLGSKQRVMKFKILLWNARGLRNKKEEIYVRIQNYDICVVTD